MKSFIFGEGQAAKTPQELAQMRAYAEALSRASGRTPQNVGEGLHALGQGLSARMAMNAANKSQQAGLQSAFGAMTPIAAALSGPGAFPPAPGTPGGDPGGVPVAAAPQMDPASARVAQAHGAGPSMPGNMSAYADAIASIESAGSGDYAALGPLTKKGNRAYGRYQVMDFNVGPWTEAALGKRMSPKEFLSDPAAQDAVFNHRFGDYVSQYGPEGAASMWFTGQPHAPNAKDILGTSGAGYVGKFNRALQQRQARAPGPTQVASLDPGIGLPAPQESPQQLPSGPDAPLPLSRAYSAIPAVDSRGEDQHSKFRQWNPYPVESEAANLAQVNPDLQRVIARAKEIAGQDFVLGSGKRDEDMQRKAVDWGWSKTMDSDHLGGDAADLWPLNDRGQVSFEPQGQQQIVAAMKQAAQELGVNLEAGADWKGFQDRPHFGVTGGQRAPNGQAAIAQALTPPAAAMPPAQAPAVNPQVAQALAPQGTQGRLPAPPLPAPRSIPEAPMVASVPQQMQQQPAPSVAQALMPPQQRPAPTGPMPEMAGNTQHIDTTRGPSMQQIMQAASNPWLNDSQRGLLNGLMQQQMAERDPLTAMQREKAQLELEKLRNPKPDIPDSVQALDLRAQRAGLQPGTKEYNDFMVSGGRSGVNVNVDTGTIPQGYQAVRDENGRLLRYEPVAGGPADTTQNEAERANRQQTQTDIITTAAGEARKLANEWFTTGTPGRLAANLSESDAAELRRQTAVLTSNATIENLNQMRQQSPTGGALGNVTEKEGAMLAAASGALDPNAGREAYMKALDNYERTLLRVVHGPKVGDAIFEQTREAESNKPVSEMSDEELEAIINGNR